MDKVKAAFFSEPGGNVLDDQTIVTTLCPDGKERIRRWLSFIESGRTELRALVTHHFKLNDIESVYDLFGHQRDGVLKLAIKL